ncbi:hypothetical protein JG688_00003707 [Phytophthora aleatoria]|uniref:DUSP domain-containing protein n=1 Tax=Phytophthora aleatoria TaxID=2496075 RepID=A0A8J5IT20_9STRA|nr:hypothetical protein JG688_00003707 [Phytophthora aleatoria]
MLAMLSGIKPTSTKRDPMHETPGTPTGDYSPISGRVVKPSSLIVAGMDITTWPIIEIDVPAGPLGILLDGSCTDAALLDDFAPVTREGAPGAIEANGNVPHGSVLIGMDKLDFMQPRKSLEEIGTVLREAAHLKRQLRFKVPPLNHQKLAKNPHDDKSKLIIGPTSSATDPSEDVKAGGEWSNMLWSGLRAATTLTAAKTSTETVEDMELRRRLELQLVMSYDRKELKFKEFWFAVHSEWMNRWALFAGKGGPEPGPITNHELLEPGFAIGEDPNRVAFVRPGLEIMKDFRFVTPMVWSLLAALHGPGDAPPIARFTLDINSEAPEDVNEVLHEAKAQATGLATSIREKCQVEVK